MLNLEPISIYQQKLGITQMINCFESLSIDDAYTVVLFVILVAALVIGFARVFEDRYL